VSRWRRPDSDQKAAFESFVQHQGRALAALARGLTPSSADADDLLQDALTKVLERWERVAGADDPYLYARRIMVNTCTSTWRQRHRELHDRSAEELITSGVGERSALWRTADADGGLAVLSNRMAVMESLRQLPPRQRTVVVLRYLEDLGDDQIAELMGITTVTVRSTALRALRALRQLNTA
jgi:RNA polymerase sigma-70 factor (sigma-E family)